ncbi:Glutaredoxin arsenate reductase [Curvibacter sp. AEP1-3]|uniref:arsenate reductase ArsC n=1 Tax=Curvibacter sp. AEP1-3 TaxID=1844971 RepID=UPI000B3CC9D8|nr:arsenate reductase ArsC [Curvibacter sp. AEP1-3]ARV20970.1 Glutaredoxin arsenate reductase [Curvibacter sp. AEP1-3]
MSAKPLNVLFLCTHNSARSILAEATLNHIGGGRFKGFSAGSSPRENQQPNPMGLQTLRNAGISVDGLRSKSWDEFALPDAPHMDLIITVCDNAAGEVCPFWPGKPATAHWGYADPSAGDGSDEQKAEAFKNTLHAIHQRLELLVNLPADKLDAMVLQQTAKELATA